MHALMRTTHAEGGKYGSAAEGQFGARESLAGSAAGDGDER